MIKASLNLFLVHGLFVTNDDSWCRLRGSHVYISLLYISQIYEGHFYVRRTVDLLKRAKVNMLHNSGVQVKTSPSQNAP